MKEQYINIEILTEILGIKVDEETREPKELIEMVKKDGNNIEIYYCTNVEGLKHHIEKVDINILTNQYKQYLLDRDYTFFIAMDKNGSFLKIFPPNIPIGYPPIEFKQQVTELEVFDNAYKSLFLP